MYCIMILCKTEMDLFVSVRYQNRKCFSTIFCNTLDLFVDMSVGLYNIICKVKVIYTNLLLLLLLLISVRLSLMFMNLSFTNITKRTLTGI